MRRIQSVSRDCVKITDAVNSERATYVSVPFREDFVRATLCVHEREGESDGNSFTMHHYM